MVTVPIYFSFISLGLGAKLGLGAGLGAGFGGLGGAAVTPLIPGYDGGDIASNAISGGLVGGAIGLGGVAAAPYIAGVGVAATAGSWDAPLTIAGSGTCGADFF